MQTLKSTLLILCSALLLIISPVETTQAEPAMDWTHWRGPEMNGISRETGLVDKWDPKGGEGSNLLWKRDDLGSRATPIVMNGKLYTILRHKPGSKIEQEKVVCLDAATGKTLWENKFNIFLSDVPDTRVGWSSVFGDPATGNVFALGVCGYFQCLDGETGKTLWSHSLSEEYGLLSTYGGRTNFPIVHENLVIISAIVIGWGEMAKPAHRFIAFDKRNGQPVWFESTRVLPYDTTYSSPVLAVLNGQKALVFGSGDGGIHAFQPRTGKSIWKYDVSKRGINATPLVVGNKVFAGHSEENIDSTEMGSFFALDGSKTGDLSKDGVLWKNNEWYVGKNQPIHIDGRLYVVQDSGKMLVVDVETGKKIALIKLGTTQRGSPLYADGKIYTATMNGRWYVLEPNEKGAKKIHSLRLRNEAVHASPIVSHGRIYLATTEHLYCIGKKDAKPTATKIPEPVKETPVTEDRTPAHLQVVPVESLLHPKNSQEFSVYLYNKNGQFLKVAKPSDVDFSISGPGKIDENGKYFTPDASAGHQAISVKAKMGELTGDARIRFMPKLAWSFDFNDGQVPITWVGARYRCIPLDFDFFSELNKKDPKMGQLYIYLNSLFVNIGTTKLALDNSNPRGNWTALLEFMELDDPETTPKDVESAKKVFDPILKELKDQKYLADWSWDTWSKKADNGVSVGGPKLMLSKGTREVTGNGVMTKIKTIPKGARSQSWMGFPDLTNYTIQADVMGAKKDDKMPDIGLIGQRYTLDMMGANQKLQIRTWTPQLRMASTVDFKWESDTWYTIKLKTAVEDGKAVLRGKAWKRGEDEPKEWMVTATDDVPSENGSPGFFGNAKDAEIFYDNIKVMSNESDSEPKEESK